METTETDTVSQPEGRVPLRLNLGSGRYPLDGFENCDIFPFPKVRHLVDLDHQPIPFPDSSVDFILMSEFFEHLAHRDHFWREVHRVLRVGGRVEIRSHYGAANGDLFHLAPLTRRSIRHLTNGYIGRFHQVGKIRYKNLGGWPWWHIRKYLHVEPPCIPGLMSGLEFDVILEKDA